MRVLVTGACGFVGTYLVRALAAANFEVYSTVLSKEVLSSRPDGGGEIRTLSQEVFPLDITNGDNCRAIIQQVRPEAVCHLAGIAFAPQASKDFLGTLQVNVGGTYQLAEAVSHEASGIPFLLASSGEVYGKVSESALPITERTPVRPNNPYSVTKVQAEEVVRYFSRRGDLKGIIARPFNHIGPGQSEHFVCSSFAKQLAEIAKGKREPVVRVGNLEALRDFMDVRDVVRGYVQLLRAPEGTYNLSSGTSVSIQSILDLLIDLSGVQVDVERDPERMRPAEVREVRGAFDLMYRTFQWKPEIDIESSLREIYEDWRVRV